MQLYIILSNFSHYNIFFQMGQKPGCCSKEFEKNLGRKSVPINVINNVP